MSATDELRHLLDERGVEWACHGYENHTWWNGSGVFGWHAENRPSVNGSFVKIGAVITPEQAIAATLGGVPDEIELTQTYDAGFRNGVMAVFQQLEGIEDYEGLQDLIAEYWGEGEGNDER